jgi:hypothetical protein
MELVENLGLIESIAAIAASAVAIGGAGFGYLNYRRARKREVPTIRIDGATMNIAGSPPEAGSQILSLNIGLTNVGEGLARKIEIGAWLYMVTSDKFTVPSDNNLRDSHFVAHIDAIKSGETSALMAYRHGSANAAASIPVFDSTAVPVTKVRAEYRDAFGKEFIAVNVFAGKPLHHEIMGYEHRPE